MTRDGRDASSIRDGMVYDNRNLLIEMILHNTSTGMGAPVTEMRKLVFDYDEAGNRVRKREYLHGATESTPGTGDGGVPTAPDGGIESGTWNLVGDEYYSRDISGKEIAIYHSNDLYQWNVWGTDNVGKITANGAKFFYLKDHLGTIRVVLDASNNIVSANDYDCWGYPLENRSYQGNNTDYKFTGKQRDKESGYDYFGARYYDARVANWGSVDPLFEKSISYSPYCYVLRIPTIYIDPKGKEWYYIWDEGGKSGEWQFYRNKPKMEVWKGTYDDKGNKIIEEQIGKKELLTFDGEYLTWLKENGNTQSWYAVSGVLENDKTQPSKQGEENYGPIPSGWYSVDPKESKALESEQNILEMMKWIYKSPSWGFAYTPIRRAEGNKTKRDNFFIHGGFWPGSIGCIDLTNNNEAFHSEFVSHGKKLDLHVEY